MGKVTIKFDTMSLGQLKALVSRAEKEIVKRESVTKRTKLEANLKKVTWEEMEESPGFMCQVKWYTPPSFRKKMDAPYRTTFDKAGRCRWFAKTKTGKLWWFNSRHRRWERDYE